MVRDGPNRNSGRDNPINPSVHTVTHARPRIRKNLNPIRSVWRTIGEAQKTSLAAPVVAILSALHLRDRCSDCTGHRKKCPSRSEVPRFLNFCCPYTAQTESAVTDERIETSCPRPVPEITRPAETANVRSSDRSRDPTPASSLTMSDSSAHPALLTPQFSAAFPRFLHTHAETPTPSLRLFDKLVWNCRLFRRYRPDTLTAASRRLRKVPRGIAQAAIVSSPFTSEQPPRCNTAVWVTPVSMCRPSVSEP